MASGIPDGRDLVGTVVTYLRESGFAIEPAPVRDAFVVRAYRGTPFPLTPTLVIPPALFREYLEHMADRMGDEQDPFGEAMSLTKVHLVEELATDHGDGLNYVSGLGYRRKRGKVEFFVDQEIPRPGQRPPASADLEWRAYPPVPEERG
jgi:hypothetical protein